MAIIQALIDHDHMFARTDRKIILNNLSLTDAGLKELIYTTYENEISLIPSCECGHYKKAYLLGRECPICHTTVIKSFDNIQPILWIEKFDENIPFINPKFWADLSKIMNSKIDSLQWLADTSYNPKKIPPYLHNIKEIIGGRSYLNVINNIDKIFKYLFNNSSFKTLSKQIRLKELYIVYKKNKHILFNNYIPLINKKLFVVENTNKGNYTFMILADIIDLAMLAVSSNNDPTITQKKKERNTAKIVAKSAQLFVKYTRDMVSKKGGLARKNIYGTRAHFTFRAVISSLRSIYDYDTIHVPWQIGPTVFRPQLINKLFKRGFTVIEASDLLHRATLRYDPLIDELLQELIDESPYKGLPVLANRNPSLLIGSIQRVFITKFKKDVTDNTVSISILIIKAPNGDFDGDELNFSLLLDNYLAETAEKYAPHVNIPAMDIFKISGNLNLPATSSLTLTNYLSIEEPEAEEDPVADMIIQIEKETTL